MKLWFIEIIGILPLTSKGLGFHYFFVAKVFLGWGRKLLSMNKTVIHLGRFLSHELSAFALMRGEKYLTSRGFFYCFISHKTFNTKHLAEFFMASDLVYWKIQKCLIGAFPPPEPRES